MKPTLAIATADDIIWDRYQELGNEWDLEQIVDGAMLLSKNFDRPVTLVIDADLPGLPAWSDERLHALLSCHTAVAITGTPNPQFGIVALDAGVAGYCHAYSAPETLRQALRTVAAGQLWIGRDVMNQLLQRLDGDLPSNSVNNWHNGLTEREYQVSQRAAFGETNADIATALNITERTVKAHLSAAFEKLGVSDRLQLALRAHGIK